MSEPSGILVLIAQDRLKLLEDVVRFATMVMNTTPDNRDPVRYAKDADALYEALCRLNAYDHPEPDTVCNGGDPDGLC